MTLSLLDSQQLLFSAFLLHIRKFQAFGTQVLSIFRIFVQLHPKAGIQIPAVSTGTNILIVVIRTICLATGPGLCLNLIFLIHNG